MDKTGEFGTVMTKLLSLKSALVCVLGRQGSCSSYETLFVSCDCIGIKLGNLWRKEPSAEQSLLLPNHFFFEKSRFPLT